MIALLAHEVCHAITPPPHDKLFFKTMLKAVHILEKLSFLEAAKEICIDYASLTQEADLRKQALLEATRLHNLIQRNGKGLSDQGRRQAGFPRERACGAGPCPNTLCVHRLPAGLRDRGRRLHMSPGQRLPRKGGMDIGPARQEDEARSHANVLLRAFSDLARSARIQAIPIAARPTRGRAVVSLNLDPSAG